MGRGGDSDRRLHSGEYQRYLPAFRYRIFTRPSMARVVFRDLHRRLFEGTCYMVVNRGASAVMRRYPSWGWGQKSGRPFRWHIHHLLVQFD